MDPKLDHIARELRTARQAKLLSQRDLSSMAGIPQAKISKIENGTLNPTLSTLIDIGRALDLELVLIPRKLLPAVSSLLRGEKLSRPESDGGRKELKQLSKYFSPFEPLLTDQIRHRFHRIVAELKNVRLNKEDTAKLRSLTELVRHWQNEQPQSTDFDELINSMRLIRNHRVHATPESASAPRPAYSLNDEDEDA